MFNMPGGIRTICTWSWKAHVKTDGQTETEKDTLQNCVQGTLTFIYAQ